jgi:hypothetical protein
MTKLKVALCMRGAVSKGDARFIYKNDLYNDSEYVDYAKCFRSILKHIIEPNKDKYEFDIFCHCWNYDLEDEICKLYNPKKKLFEDNRKYNNEISDLCQDPSDFSGISQSLTIQKSINLKEEYEMENNIHYDIVILYRYDVFLWKNILLMNYINLEKNIIYVNGDTISDFHFIMNNEVSKSFKYLYNSVKLGNRHKTHYWIKNYIIHYMNKELVADNIFPARCQACIRKLMNASIIPGHLSLEIFNSY